MSTEPVPAGNGAVCCFCTSEKGTLYWTTDGRLTHRACIVRAQRRALTTHHRNEEIITKPGETRRARTGGTYA